VVVALALSLLCAVPAAAQDPDAPAGALAHWLPNERWVYQHWLPYDERRLERLLGVDRGAIWRHLRDDHAHSLAQLARRRGMRPGALATRLVAPRRGRVPARRVALLRSRALRTLTQGHLAQHILFHSLHQTAIPNRAMDIFGVAPGEFRRLRRAELSPLQIGRLHGRSAAEMHRGSVAALRRMARRGVRGKAMTARQARLLLDRQIRQVPRWLGQSRYNGPPQTSPDAKPVLPAADFANNPSLSDDGRRVVWDAYRVTIPEARRLGEIRVVGMDLDRARRFEVSHAGARVGLPRSAYNSVLSADGRTVVYEVSEGNLNFAKRYGAMHVLAQRVGGGAPVEVSHPAARRGTPSRTAYNPSVSRDGSVVAFEATDAGRGGAPSRNGVWAARVARTADGGALVRASEPSRVLFGPRVTGDGRSAVLTVATAAGRAQVHLVPLGGGRSVLVSRASGARGPAADADAHDPAASADGSVVAFASSAGNLGRRGPRSRVWVRDVARARTTAVSGRGWASDPAVSADGRFVAFVTRPLRRGRPHPERASLWLHDRRSGRTVLVSRRDGPDGARADGASTEPSVSADGRRVAFTSTAGNLARGKPRGIAGVFVRDLGAGTTRLVSTHTPLGAARRSARREPHDGHGARG